MDHPSTPERPDHLNPAGNALRGVSEGRNATEGVPYGAAGASPTTEPPVPPAAPPPPMTPTAWLKNNGIYLLLMLAGCIALYRSGGLDFLWRALLVIFGLGMVVFIHELGHFLAAKWCDVHVQTFSIGFGPALPGCSFQKGETLYKIGILPLGGYVNMVGEGTDTEEGEDYPRSFKNKTVGQRMLIISAGVIMNVLLGAVCFISVYLFLGGVERPPAVVGRVEPGGVAWKHRVRSGMKITQIGKIHNPWFDDLKLEVALSDWGNEIPFTFKSPTTGEVLEVHLEPRKDLNDPFPVIGVAAPLSLKLYNADFKKIHETPYFYDTPAAHARVMADLSKDDKVLRATDPEHRDQLTDLPKEPGKCLLELCERMTKLGKDPLVLEVLRADGKTEKLDVPAVGFDFGDTIIATTDPDHPDSPFTIKELPPSPEQPRSGEPTRDYFEYAKRLKQLAGKPMVMQVVRDKDKSETPHNILVPPAYHWTLGVNMVMGEVVAVRDGSPAQKAGMEIPSKTGDKIIEVVMLFTDKDGKVKEQTIYSDKDDPTRLPFELAKAARERPAPSKPIKIKLTVLEYKPNLQTGKVPNPRTVEMDWDDSWDYQLEAPISLSAPMSIPQLGIAYRVQTTVTEVKADSPAAEAKIQKDDVFEQVSYRKGGAKSSAAVSWTGFFELKSKRGPDGKEVYDRWANIFWGLQHNDYHEIRVKVRRGDALLSEPVTLRATPDRTWPLADRGLFLEGEVQLQKADTVTQALTLGLDRTWATLKQMYANLRSLFSGRISTDTMGGPIELAAQTFMMASSMPALILFLGMISLNLAVVNFLPIPVLDGGHMVFLIYEKLRGKPPSETVRMIATYVGLFIILFLMVFVFWLDIKRRILPMFFKN